MAANYRCLWFIQYWVTEGSDPLLDGVHHMNELLIKNEIAVVAAIDPSLASALTQAVQ